MIHHRADKTEYQRAVDWQQRISRRWWIGIGVAYGAAGVLFIVGGVLRAVGS